MKLQRCSCLLVVVFCLLPQLCRSASAQDDPTPPDLSPVIAPDAEKSIQAPAKVDIEPEAADSDIAARLRRILEATGWFESPAVEVREGVVFLSGSTTEEHYKTWAGDLARKTQDVAAVVNRIEIQRAPLWDVSAGWQELRDLWRQFLLALPNILFGVLILLVAWWIGKLVTMFSRRAAERRFDTPLLREVLARTAGFVVFLLGLYLVLRISGLTRLAVTVLGGTGLVGLIIGIAFRDITENFLASIFLSMQHPFRQGDLIEITGVLGYVQRLTTRTTIVMTLDGHHVQIPNSIVYKNTIRNFSSNPNRREIFSVGIGYEDAIAEAQAIALQVLADHPAVLKQPEPWVLVDSLGAATVNLKIYFWLNGAEHSWLKMRSSVIRLVKRAFQENGISMPDEAREVVFPQGVAVELLRKGADTRDGNGKGHQPNIESSDVSTQAEASLEAEAKTIESQARRSRMPEEGEDLLRSGH